MRSSRINSRVIKAFVDSYLMETLLKVPVELRMDSKVESLDELSYELSKKDFRLGSKLEEKISDGFYELLLDDLYGEDGDREYEDELREELHEGAWNLLTRKGIVGNMKRTSHAQTLRSLETRIARLEKSAVQWPPANEKATDRQGKISHLLRIILDNCETLGKFEVGFINDMLRLLNQRRGIEPATALSEKQARTLRQIIYRRYRDYKHAVPSLPAGVKFEDEVRRLLKSQPNPNEARNELIQRGKGLLNQYLEDLAERNEFWDGEKRIGGTKYKKVDGNVVTFEVKWIMAEGGSYLEYFSVNVNTNEINSNGGYPN